MTHPVGLKLKDELGLDGFEFFVDSEWSSRRPAYRAILRQEIRTRFKATPAILDLTAIPKLPSHSLSISHCRAVGGFCVADKSAHPAIGFDVELNERVHLRHLRQVADEAELHRAPTIQALWTAKEAAYKCLQGPLQPKGVKDVRITRWRLLDAKTFGFEVEGVSDVRGVAVENENLTCSVCATDGGMEQ